MTSIYRHPISLGGGSPAAKAEKTRQKIANLRSFPFPSFPHERSKLTNRGIRCHECLRFHHGRSARVIHPSKLPSHHSTVLPSPSTSSASYKSYQSREIVEFRHSQALPSSLFRPYRLNRSSSLSTSPRTSRVELPSTRLDDPHFRRKHHLLPRTYPALSPSKRKLKS